VVVPWTDLSMPDSVLGTVIVPVLNEVRGIDARLTELMSGLRQRWKIVVCDGGSTDGTVEILSQFPVTVVVSEPGRARQMNAGAALAEGPVLLFLHADTVLPTDFAEKMQAFLQSECHWGRFDVTLDQPSWYYKTISWFINTRSALTGVCTGDQTLFMRLEFFQNLDGFAELPLMEDVEWSLRARKVQWPYRIRTPVITSARKWVEHGVVRTVLLMWWLRLAFRLGVNPHRLHRWYYG